MAGKGTARIMAEVAAVTRLKLEASAIVVEGAAKGAAPVDTGRLRSSVTHAVEGESALVGTNVEYGPAVHNGTRFQSPQPFLVDGLTSSKEKLRGIWLA